DLIVTGVQTCALPIFVNLADYTLGIAPGSLVVIFGRNLAGATAQAPTLPLPTQLAGASISIGGLRCPLLFASPGQVNAEIPFERSEERRVGKECVRRK